MKRTKMKRTTLFPFSFFLFPCLALTKVSVPQAPVITYGLIRNEYGDPMTAASAAKLTLVKDADRNGRVYAASDVGDSGIPGMNYRLSLEIDSLGPTRDTAVVKGTRMFVKATVGGVEATLSPAATFATPAQGTKQRLDFSTGDDLDGDGMPDSWEESMLYLAGRDFDFEDIVNFRPDEDDDGDGMSNKQEYLAGTDPFLATDLFKVESFEVIPGTDRAKITFTTAFGRRYRVLMTEAAGGVNWTPVATSQELSGELTYDTLAGDGASHTVYVDARLGAMMFRVAAN